MENSSYKLLFEYTSKDKINFLESLNIYLYRSAVVFVGFEDSKKEEISVILHYQFNELGLENVFSTQIQLISDELPNYIVNSTNIDAYHSESSFALIPDEFSNSINSIDYFVKLNSTSDKILTTQIDSLAIKEVYNIPYRIYNDICNVFENVKFENYHKFAFNKLKTISKNQKIVFVSIKSCSLDILVFENGDLLFANNFEYKNKADIIYFLQTVLDKVNIQHDSNKIYVTCIRKNEANDILDTLSSYFININSEISGVFNVKDDFWKVYGDLILNK